MRIIAHVLHNACMVFKKMDIFAIQQHLYADRRGGLSGKTVGINCHIMI